MSYKIDVYFRCQDMARLYLLIDCLKEVALHFGAKNPYPVYLGDGYFQVTWSKRGMAEIQDTKQGMARLWTSKINRNQYENIRAIFRAFWKENYSPVNKEKVRRIHRYRKTRRITNLRNLFDHGI